MCEEGTILCSTSSHPPREGRGGGGGSPGRCTAARGQRGRVAPRAPQPAGGFFFGRSPKEEKQSRHHGALPDPLLRLGWLGPATGALGHQTGTLSPGTRVALHCCVERTHSPGAPHAAQALTQQEKRVFTQILKRHQLQVWVLRGRAKHAAVWQQQPRAELWVRARKGSPQPGAPHVPNTQGSAARQPLRHPPMGHGPQQRDAAVPKSQTPSFPLPPGTPHTTDGCRRSRHRAFPHATLPSHGLLPSRRIPGCWQHHTTQLHGSCSGLLMLQICSTRHKPAQEPQPAVSPPAAGRRAEDVPRSGFILRPFPPWQ